MNRDSLIKIILIAIVLMDIMNGDFTNPSMLDIVKWILLIICFILMFRRDRNAKR